MINIKSRKTGEFLDYALHLKDGTEYMNPDHINLGDTLVIKVRLSEEQAAAMKALGYEDFQPHDLGLGIKPDWAADVQFEVIKRVHNTMPLGGDKLKWLGTTLTLQATHFRWEDLYRWVFEKKIPDWAGKKKAAKRS